MAEKEFKIKQSSALTKIPKDFPESSIYVEGAVSSFMEPKKARLEDICILAKDPDQLKYIYKSHPTKEHPEAMEVKQLMSYVKIDSEPIFWKFMQTFLNDSDALDQGKIPDALTKVFDAYEHHTDAEKKKQQLIKLQNKYYDSLVQNAKPQTNKQQIVVVDLVKVMMDYIQRIILPSVTSDPDFIKKFKQNENVH